MTPDTPVSCSHCGKTDKVSFAYCLGHGWPKCCGYTMTMGKTEANIHDAVGSLFPPWMRKGERL